MTTRIAHRLAHQATAASCTRCLDVFELRAGAWHAGEPGHPLQAVCDRCARRDDPNGFEMVASFRRMAGATWRTAA